MDKDLIKTLVPINSLTPENFRELCARTSNENLPAGSQLFKQGDHDNQPVYLLSGEMRLTKKDFDGLMCEPLVKWVTLNGAKDLAQAGAGLLDVRIEDKFRNGTIKGSMNLPLYQLRLKASSLEPRHHYIVFCQTGSRSYAAAFLLSQRGFEVSVLRGGLNGLTRVA